MQKELSITPTIFCCNDKDGYAIFISRNLLMLTPPIKPDFLSKNDSLKESLWR